MVFVMGYYGMLNEQDQLNPCDLSLHDKFTSQPYCKTIFCKVFSHVAISAQHAVLHK